MKKRQLKKFNKGGFLNIFTNNEKPQIKHDVKLQERKKINIPEGQKFPPDNNYQIKVNQIDKTQIEKVNNKVDKIKEKSKISGGDGSQYLEFNLDEGESIYTASGTLVYNDNRIEQAELKYDGMFQNIKKMFAGENLFYQKFKGKQGIKKGGIVVVGTSFINSIICIKVEANKPLRFSRGSFLASTTNIKIDLTTQMKGILGIGQEEGFFLPIAVCTFGNYGYVWLSAYGSFKEIDMSESGYEITIDNGMFLACDNSKQYEIVLMGNGLFSSFFGGEGFGMRFTSGTPLYIQTKNSNELLATNESVGGEEDGISNNGFEGNLFEGFGDE
jgi:uncharacterized protein (AIM24 family)